MQFFQIFFLLLLPFTFACNSQLEATLRTAETTLNNIQTKQLLLEAKGNALEALAGRNHANTLRDCRDWYELGATIDGVYTITPISGISFKVYCIMTRLGGGWTVIQKRYDGSLNFNENWGQFRNGFGDRNGEHWGGLEMAYRVSGLGNTQLRVEVRHEDGTDHYAEYATFNVGSESTSYLANVQNYIGGTSGDILILSCATGGSVSGATFSTYDRDTDTSSSSCALQFKSGWWYKSCSWTHLNMPWGSNWYQTYNCLTYNRYLKGSTMLIKRT